MPADGIVLTPELFARISRAVRWVETQRRGNAYEGQFVPPLATFLNDSGSTIPAYGIFYDDDMTVSQYHPIVTAKQCSTSVWSWNWYVNGDRDVEDGDRGQYQTTPFVKLLYDTGTPALNDGYGPKPGQFEASKDYPMQFICRGILNEDDQVMWALNLGCIQSVFGQTQGSIAKNATNGTIEPFYGAPGSGATIVNSSLTIYGVCNPWETVADNKKVLCRLVNGRPTLSGKEC